MIQLETKQTVQGQPLRCSFCKKVVAKVFRGPTLFDVDKHGPHLAGTATRICMDCLAGATALARAP